MAFDGITVAAVAAELKKDLLNSRIYKIAQPESDELILTLKTTDGGQKRLRQKAFTESFLRNGKGIGLVLCLRNEIIASRKNLADRAYHTGNMLDAVDDFIFLIHEDDVAMLSHQLDDQALVAKITHIIIMLHVKFKDTL